MSTPWKVSLGLSINGVAISPAIEKTLTGEGGAYFDVTVANGQTDKEVVCAVDYSQLAGIVLVSDQAVTFETNDGGAAADTIALVANVPHLWITGSPQANGITEDVTAGFVTNASGSSARVRGWWIYADATP